VAGASYDGLASTPAISTPQPLDRLHCNQIRRDDPVEPDGSIQILSNETEPYKPMIFFDTSCIVPSTSS